jgi:hypothetical protein
VASLSSELETLQKLLRDAGRDEQEPIYFSLDDGAEPEAALDQLIKAGKITGRERDRVGFIVRTIIGPKPWSTDLESAAKKDNHIYIQ